MQTAPKWIGAASSLRDAGGNDPKNEQRTGKIDHRNTTPADRPPQGAIAGHHQEGSNSRAALAYATAGLAIFPCSTAPKSSDPSKPDKSPIPKFAPNGFKSASADLAIVRGWWNAAPYALIGLACGAASVVVIDLDKRPEADGVTAFRDLARAHGGLPDGVVIVRTISGGYHLFFAQAHGEPLGNSTGALPRGVDVRGCGGYIIAPPSMWRGHGWRETDRSPRLLDALTNRTLPPPPVWLVDQIRPPRRSSQIAQNRSPLIADDDAEAAYLACALDFIPADDRDVWLRIGGALHDKFGSAGRALWDHWSQGSQKFDAASQDRAWRSFHRPTQRKATAAFIVAEARRNGFHGSKYGRHG